MADAVFIIPFILFEKYNLFEAAHIIKHSATVIKAPIITLYMLYTAVEGKPIRDDAVF